MFCITTFLDDSWLQMLDHCCQGQPSGANDGQKLRNFKLFWRLYTYNPEQGTFDPVPAMPLHLPRQIRRALESLHSINTAGNKMSNMDLQCFRLVHTLLLLHCSKT